MHRLSLILITLLSALSAQEYTLEPIHVEAIQDAFTQTQENALDKNAFTLQERLEHDVSFDVVGGEKNNAGLSYRGVDARATTYYEDGIPLYKINSGETATMTYHPNGNLTINSNAPSIMGVSSMGADVLLTTTPPTKSLEAMVLGSLSNNDERAEAYLASRFGQGYLQFNASTYHMGSYTLSDDYTATPAQGTGERRYSNRTQHDASLKMGYYPDSHSHIAAKVAISRADFGVSPNTYTDITHGAGYGNPPFTGNLVPWDAFTNVPEKKLNSFYLYGDFAHGDIDTTVRAYYDRYQDVFAFYTDNTYSSYLGGTLDTWSDSRLGSSIKSALKSDTHTDALSLTLQRDTHRWISTGTNSAHYTNNSLEASYLGDYALNDTLRLEGALSYRVLQPSQEFDTRNTFTNYETKSLLDYQLKLSQVAGDNTLYAAAAHKSRFPSMLEMYPLLQGDTPISNLNPEQSRNLEAGITHRGISKTLLSLEGYYYDIKDLIVKPSYTYYNRESAKNYGIETRVSSDYFTSHHLSASYRYARTRDSAGEQIELIPTHRLTAEEAYDIAPDFTATLAYQYVADRYSSYLDQQHKLDSYYTLDTYLSYVKKEGVSYRCGIKNLTDEAYEWRYGYPTQGRSIFATLSWNL